MNWSDLIWIAAIVVGAIIVRLVLSRVGRRVLGGAIRSEGKLRHRDPVLVERKASTLVSTLTWTITVLVGFVSAALMLTVFGVAVGPLLTSLGIVGVALGFGAQTLIRDVINGIFILTENQFGIGDTIRTSGVEGEVVEFNLRRTLLRGEDGNLHSVSNSSIAVSSNLTRDFSRIDITVPVAHDEDLGRVMAVINSEGEALAADHPDDSVSRPRVARVEGFDGDAVTFRILGDVRAGQQWALTSELLLRLKARFAADGVRLPGEAKPAEEEPPEAADPDPASE